MSADAASSANSPVDAPTVETSRQVTGASEGTQRERVPVLIFDTPDAMSCQVARRIANLIEERQAVNQTLVLGLPTGSTPIGVYKELIRMHRDEGLDFSNVVTFNLDEYYPMDPESLQSYHRFMEENFFNHVNIPEENIHIPRGDIPREEVERHCIEYEHAIEKAGGIDLMLLGIGRSGHVGFNEPGSGKDTRTRMIILDEITRKDAASDFFGEENVPKEAITMGVGSILDAEEIILMATGEHKAPIVKRAVEEPSSRDVTASYLQDHRDATFYVDRAAAGELTRVKTPWLVREVDWTKQGAKRAVSWLSKTLDKAIPRLESADFYRNQLHGLVHQYDHIDALTREVFEDLRQRVKYQEDVITEERVIVFSPHPDDDVISMGGMLSNLVENENDVTVAYMTSGNVAVFDADVRRYLRFVELSSNALDMDEEDLKDFRARREKIESFFEEKDPGEVDLPEVQELKAHIRAGEAVAATGVMGLTPEDARFLDMPFYKTGRVRKDPISEADVEVVLNLLEEVQPTNIFVAGDLSDPHGTHRMCYQAINEAIQRYRSAPAEENGEVDETTPDPRIWLYRGAWQEWETYRADVFLPLSKADLDQKVEAIYKHESQKDRAMFPGAYDEREFWQRARDRNRDTADTLNQLGLPEFYAAEAFVTTYEMP